MRTRRRAATGPQARARPTSHAPRDSITRTVPETDDMAVATNASSAWRVGEHQSPESTMAASRAELRLEHRQARIEARPLEVGEARSRA